MPFKCFELFLYNTELFTMYNMQQYVCQPIIQLFSNNPIL